MPRDNGTEGMLRTASFIDATLWGHGPEVTIQAPATPQQVWCSCRSAHGTGGTR